jgi:hypothetical protein
MTYRCSEDFRPGEIATLGSRSISEAEITAFARLRKMCHGARRWSA